MALPRRFLPATPLLSAFEAAARHQNFTAAAVELNLTQSAVSRQIRSLEMMLGSDLFHREKQTVKLTSAGSSYARVVREALARISSATLDFRASPSGGSIRIAMPPTVGSSWLIPRLPDFLSREPRITVHLITNLDVFDFSGQVADAAIHFGTPSVQGMEMAYLMSEKVVPVCSPEFRARYAFAHPQDLLVAPLIHLVSRPDAWERWFAAMEVEFPLIHGMLTDQFSFAIEAARASLGVALVPEFLIKKELAAGDLAIAIDRPLANRESYFLIWPPILNEYGPLLTFKSWILEQADDFRRDLGSPEDGRTNETGQK